MLAHLAAAAASCGPCEEPAPERPPDAAPVAVAPPPAEGCARSGALEGIDKDPACGLSRVRDDAMTEAMRHLSIELVADPADVVAGLSSVLRLSIANTSSSEVLVVLAAQPRGSGTRPDWSRLAGVPGLRGDAGDDTRLSFPTSTLDARARSVDALPTVASPVSGPARLLGVRLRPGGRLTHAMAWWALRIPPPAPIIKLDGGLRIVPKTIPVPLAAGEYIVQVELPLHGVPPAERVVSTRVRVEPATVKDAGRRKTGP